MIRMRQSTDTKDIYNAHKGLTMYTCWSSDKQRDMWIFWPHKISKPIDIQVLKPNHKCILILYSERTCDDAHEQRCHTTSMRYRCT